MKRVIDNTLLNWKHSTHRKPLILRGARQVGKTFSIRQLGFAHFSNMVHLDFERDISLSKLFDGDLSPDTLLPQIELIANQKITPGETLLFFDEIQECQRAILSLRYFYEQCPDLHVIAAGSMLEFALSDSSFPVGRVTFECLFPLSFKEFLLAGDNDMLLDALPSFSKKNQVSESVHSLISNQLKHYFIVGGMPEAVKRYQEENSFFNIPKIHRDLIVSYIQSLSKYKQKTDTESLDQVIKSIPAMCGQQIKYTTLDPDRRIEKTKKSLELLEKALIIHPVKAVDPNGLPLGASASSKIFKAIFFDIGLMQHLTGINPNTILQSKDLSKVYKGALAEQFVGQELLASGGSENGKLYFWRRHKKSSSAEIDYLCVKKGNIFPIEVKSGPAGSLKSLHIYLNEIRNASEGVVFSPSSHSVQRVENITFMPIYTDFSS